jgi:hypothetical protein
LEACTVKTSATPHEQYGRHVIINFFKALYEDYPDGVMVVRDVIAMEKYLVKYRFYFQGTLTSLSVGDNKVYAKKPSTSVLQSVNLSKYSPEEILQMTKKEAELKQSKRPTKIAVKGETRYYLNRGYKIARYETEFNVTAFSEGALGENIVAVCSEIDQNDGHTDASVEEASKKPAASP